MEKQIENTKGFWAMDKKGISSFEWFFEAQYWWVRHLVFWAYRYFDLILAKIGVTDDIEINLWQFLCINLLPDFVFFYFLIWVLIPMFLLQKKLAQFLILSVFTILGYALATFLIADAMGQNFDFESSPFTLFINFDLLDAIQLWLLGTGLRLFFEYLNAQRNISELKQANFETELAFLKSQISPHFLFNTLNNIATLTEISPERANATVLQLSNVLRFQLYESQKSKVPLAKEVENIKNYLQLEKIRMNKPNIEVETEGNMTPYKVSPLLFLPFVENAVKHGILKDGTVDLFLKFAVQNNRIHFEIKNRIPEQKVEHPQGGIGLNNVKRRLALLYPSQHNLSIVQQNGWFTVHLNLEHY